MAELYSYKGSYPYPLPEDMTGYDLADFYLAPTKPTLLPGQVLEWSENTWFVREANEPEVQIQWAIVRIQRDALLTNSDIFVVRAYEKGEPVPQDTVDYRKSLRDITSQPNPFSIQWPTLPAKPF